MRLGGLLVIANGWGMLHATGAPAHSEVEPEHGWERQVARRAFYPLTFPLTVGPGSISIAITLGAGLANHPAPNVVQIAIELIGVAVVALLVYICYRYAGRLVALIGETETEAFLRLSSFILLCVGVSMLWDGVADLVRALPR